MSADRIGILELDVDTRLLDLWHETAGVGDGWTIDLVGSFMRAAYAKGYTDALCEPTRGQLYRDNGYALPGRPS